MNHDRLRSHAAEDCRRASQRTLSRGADLPPTAAEKASSSGPRPRRYLAAMVTRHALAGEGGGAVAAFAKTVAKCGKRRGCAEACLAAALHGQQPRQGTDLGFGRVQGLRRKQRPGSLRGYECRMISRKNWFRIASRRRGVPLEFEDWRVGISERLMLEKGRKWCAVIDSASDPDLPALLWAFKEDADIWPLFMNS